MSHRLIGLQLSHPKLPLCSLRSYHPTYLRRRRLWAILDEVIHSVRDTATYLQESERHSVTG